MKTTNRLILVLSDLHVGSTVGLWPADFVSNEGNPIGQNHFQKWLWRCWIDMNAWAAKVTDGQPYDIVINGDIVDGIHHKTLQVMTPDLGDQVTAVKQILGELMERTGNLHFPCQPYVRFTSDDTAFTSDDTGKSHVDNRIRSTKRSQSVAHSGRAKTNPMVSTHGTFWIWR